MSKLTTVTVPDIGDFAGVEVIEILVSVGDSVAAEDSLVTLESDKASMEIPSPESGVVKEINIALGDSLSEGDAVLTLELASTAAKAPEKEAAPAAAETTPTSASTAANPSSDSDLHAEVVVLGSGPGGYTAAFRAADLGKKTLLIERYPNLGGVCLNVGCIPSKALLHSAHIITEADEMASHGITFGQPKIDLTSLVGWKNKIIKQLTGGLKALAKQRKVSVVHGLGTLLNPNQIQVKNDEGTKIIGFDNLIIAAGSEATQIPVFPNDDPRLIDSTGALELDGIPERLLVVGGGIIGLEMATVYDALGSKVTVVELSPGLIPGCDRDLVRPLEKRIKKRYENIYLNTRVTAIESQENGLKVRFEGKKAPDSDTFDKVLVAVGRVPNGHNIGAENAGVAVDERGFIAVNSQQHTNVPHIFAIGDIVGQPMLAHKATHEGKVAAEVISGMKSHFDALTIPSVAYTDPEVAWMGLTETEAKKQGIEYEKGAFPWAASGRSLSIGRNEGLTKLLFDKETKRILGAGIVGTNAGELLAEAVLALEMGADVEDIALTVHAHPTLSETINFAAEMAEGSITDLYIPRKKK
ncbi:MAG: dihydrolipoyl dehydrogenase [Gammaproteobacteria bacterium]|nr:dihydrolipoyl dehydrogenase [Gammaproteobacteria bacterium]